jgi:hypothetical protein
MKKVEIWAVCRDEDQSLVDSRPRKWTPLSYDFKGLSLTNNPNELCYGLN